MKHTALSCQRRLKATILLIGWLLSMVSSSAWAVKHFDDLDYEASTQITGTPMDTIAGLTDFAQRSNYVYGITTIVIVLVFFAVAIPLVYTIYRFRAPKEDMTDVPPPKQVEGNVILELTWTVIPVILLIFIAVPTWKAIFEQPVEPPEGSMRVNVIGHQWWWEFEYPDLGIVTAAEMHLPENTPVFLTIWSDDVMHSYWVPKLGGKVDAIPGKKNTLFFTTPKATDQAGRKGDYYQGQCAELCGLSHALMRFEAVVQTKDSFEAWAKTYNNPPVVLTEQEKKGEQVFAQCQSCHTISGTPSADLEAQMRAMDPPVKKVGPNLTGFGNRRTIAAGIRKNTAENLHQWIEKPEHLKPGSLMVGLGLSKEDIAAVAAYIRKSTAKNY